MDLEGFLAELQELRKEVDAKLGEEDLAHLRKVINIGRAASAIGMATAWMGPNPLSIAGLALGRGTRWILMHHIGHRGYDRVPGVPERYTGKVFARGARRWVDWFDWMLPEAWNYEHNVLHHGHTGEEKDPDLIERNAAWVREADLPEVARYAAIGLLSLTWRPFYYAPATLEAYREKFGDDGKGYLRQLWTTCYLPFIGKNFVLFPALFLPLGPGAAASALVNSLLAELVTNLHTFLVIGPNHTGDDIYRFDDKPGSKAETMLRQVIGSVNFACGNDLVDHAHLWLNYQIEHHIWPDLPMLRYKELQPKVKALCAKYGIPYVQESVWKRAVQTVKIAAGTATMKRMGRVVAARVVGRAARATSHGEAEATPGSVVPTGAAAAPAS